MKASEVINTLMELYNEFGDMDVYLDVDPNGLKEIGEIDVDVDDTGIIIWPGEGDKAA